MGKYLLKRIIGAFFVVIGISIIVFVAIRLAPGDPAEIMLGSYAQQDEVEKLREQMGLNRPIVVQYLFWLKDIVHLDFGTSITYHRPVLDVIVERLIPTIYLGAAALIIAVPLGLLFGSLSAIYRNKWVDKLLMSISFLGISIPVFWLGMISIIVFSLYLHIFPSSGMYSPGQTGFLNMLSHIVLPSFTLSLIPMSVIARMMKNSMLEVLNQDYIKTAQAKGCNGFQKIWRHAMRNSFVPIVTVLGVEMGYVIGGALVVENVFSWPGIGSLLLNAINTRDYPLIICGCCLLAVMYAVINLLMDIMYGIIDPRIKYE